MKGRPYERSIGDINGSPYLEHLGKCLIYRAHDIVIGKVGDNDVGLGDHLLERVCNRDHVVPQLLEEFFALGLCTVPYEDWNRALNVLVPPLCEVAGHGVAHRAETADADLYVGLAWGGGSGEGVHLGLLDVEETGVGRSVHDGGGRRESVNKGS